MAGTILVAGLSSSRKTPGIYLAVVLGGVATSAAATVKKILLMGNKITSDINTTSPAFTPAVTAGTAANATPLTLSNSDVAATYFGRGSEIHRMSKRVFEQYPDASVTGVATAESAGVRSTAVVTFVNNASAAATIRCKMNGEQFDIAIANATTITNIALAVATAILAHPDLPCTANNLAGVLTITAKHTGPRTNGYVYWLGWVDSAGNEYPFTTAGTTSAPGMTAPATTAQFTTGSTVGGCVYPTSGATQDDVTAALAAVLSTRYDRIVIAFRDATNVDLVAGQLDTMAGVTVQKLQQYVGAYLDTMANTKTFVRARNDVRGQWAWHYNSPIATEEVAAQVAAARLIGDSYAGGVLVGEATDPAANLDGMNLKGILAQRAISDQPSDTDIEDGLNNGITPLRPSGLNPGTTCIVRSVTSKCLDALSQPNYANLDTSTVTIPDYCADDLRSYLATTYQGKKLGVDSSDGSPPQIANVVTPNTVRSEIARKLKSYEASGIIKNVDTNLSLLQVLANPLVSGRLDCEIPVDPVAGLHQVGGNVRQVGSG